MYKESLHAIVKTSATIKAISNALECYGNCSELRKLELAGICANCLIFWGCGCGSKGGGRQGVRTPLENHKLYRFAIGLPFWKNGHL